MYLPMVAMKALGETASSVMACNPLAGSRTMRQILTRSPRRRDSSLLVTRGSAKGRNARALWFLSRYDTVLAPWELGIVGRFT